MKKLIIVAGVIIFFAAAAISYGVHEREPQDFEVGVVSTVNSSDTVSVLRLAVNDLIKLATSFSTTTTNTFTGVQTFSAGFVNSATSTGTKGIALTGGCFSLNGVCIGGFIASSTLLSDANTWSNAGTTTNDGNVKVTGNLQVSGNFFAPVQIVSSGNATINGTLTVTGVTTLGTSLTGFGILSSGVVSAVTAGGTNHVLYTTASNAPASEAALTYAALTDLLTFVNASSTAVTVSGFFKAPTAAACAGFALGSLCLDTTNNELQIGTSTAIIPAVLSPYRYPVFPQATTTWVGTTTENKLLAPFGGVLREMSCDMTVGTLNVQVKINATALAMFKASTTPGVITFDNGVFVRGDTITTEFGTPATAPTDIYCTGVATQNPS